MDAVVVAHRGSACVLFECAGRTSTATGCAQAVDDAGEIDLFRLAVDALKLLVLHARQKRMRECFELHAHGGRHAIAKRDGLTLSHGGEEGKGGGGGVGNCRTNDCLILLVGQAHRKDRGAL